jgi:hypothetical protein
MKKGWKLTPRRFSILTAILLVLIGLLSLQPSLFGLVSPDEVQGLRALLIGMAVGVLAVWLGWWITPASRR